MISLKKRGMLKLTLVPAADIGRSLRHRQKSIDQLTYSVVKGGGQRRTRVCVRTQGWGRR
jgi:hypothetical protein